MILARLVSLAFYIFIYCMRFGTWSFAGGGLAVRFRAQGSFANDVSCDSGVLMGYECTISCMPGVLRQLAFTVYSEVHQHR